MDETAWMDVLGEARVEVTSEDELFPVTAALGHAVTNGWRSAVTGVQVLRLIFAEPRKIERIRVDVVDRVAERTQEMVVRAGASVEALEELARWQFSFSPRGSTEEMEESAVIVDGVTVVELRIDPDVRHPGGAEQMYAVLRSFWLA